MDQKTVDLAQLLDAYEAALTEERALWAQISNTESSPADRAVAYAQWRAAAERVKTLATALHDVERLPNAGDPASGER